MEHVFSSPYQVIVPVARIELSAETIGRSNDSELGVTGDSNRTRSQPSSSDRSHGRTKEALPLSLPVIVRESLRHVLPAHCWSLSR